MKTITTKSEAYKLAFSNGIFCIKLDKRKSSVKQILKFYSEDELREIESKKINRLEKKCYHGNTNTFRDLIWRINQMKDAGSYQKILIEGNKNIYWASPVYGHADYNKSIFAENNAKNRRKMELINALITK